jgi:hypothetical protein
VIIGWVTLGPGRDQAAGGSDGVEPPPGEPAAVLPPPAHEPATVEPDAGTAQAADPGAPPVDAGPAIRPDEATPPATRRRKRPRRRRRRPRKRRKVALVRPPRPDAGVHPPPGTPIPSKKAALHATLKELDKQFVTQLRRMRRRGIRTGDDLRIDSLLHSVKKRLAAKDPDGTRAELAQLEQAVDKLVVNRAFVERKMRRLVRLIEKKGKKYEYSSATQEILDHVLNSRYHQANQAMNRILDQLD